MADVVKNVIVGVSGVNNGATVVGAMFTGQYNRFDPPINQYMTSGVMLSIYDDRFNHSTLAPYFLLGS
jgi:hypothetical protein